jgi:DNA-directed RNA polymerase subunit RPC12/RpoP
MKRMCAWCGRELDQGERRDNQPLTHGLCPECRCRFFAVAKGPDAPSVANDEGAVRENLPFEQP